MKASLHEVARRWWAGELGMAGTVLGVLLAPAEAAYRVGVAVRNGAYRRGLLAERRAAVPVISVGNIAVGGTGKTPFTHWLATRLQALGQTPAIVHGGYADDEPALHRAWSPEIPVIVERDRVVAAQRAVADGASIIVLDDAFQHRRLHRDLDIVLMSAERWTHATRLLPRGPWREPRSGLRRADLLVVTRKTASAAEAVRVADGLAVLTEAPIVHVHLRAAGWRLATAAPLPPGTTSGSAPATGNAVRTDRAAGPTTPALLVSGVAEPDLFVENARAAGANIAGILTFPDHHAYSGADADRIRTAAAGGPVVTTEKDWTRLERWFGGDAVWLLRQDVIVESGAQTLENLLQRVLP